MANFSPAKSKATPSECSSSVASMPLLKSGEMAERGFCSRAAKCHRCGCRIGFFGLTGFGWRERGHEARCARRNPAPELPPKGAYLTFSILNHGTLTLTWSETAVDDALAFISADKDVPKHKLAYAGRTETSGTGDDTKPKYRQAWATFVKAGKAYGSTLVLSEKAPVKLILLGGDNSLTRVLPGERVDLSNKKIVAVAHKDNNMFTAQTLQPTQFMDTARNTRCEVVQL